MSAAKHMQRPSSAARADERGALRRVSARLALLCALLAPGKAAFALMAGTLLATPTDSPTRRIDSNVASSPWAGVGSLRTPQGVYSATVVASDYVLTAAHVVAGVPPAEIRFALNADGDLSFGAVAAAVFVHPGFVSAQQPNANDLALVRLARPVPATAPTYSIAANPVAVQSIIVLVGYGASGDGSRGPTVAGSTSVKRVGRNVIDGFGQQSAERKQNVIALYDFDGPPGSLNRMGGPTLGNDIETMVASGDSGGPCFIFERGQWKLAGVSTFVMAPEANAGTSVFGGVGGAVLLAPHRQWLAATLHATSSAAPTLGVELRALLQKFRRWLASNVPTALVRSAHPR